MMIKMKLFWVTITILIGITLFHMLSPGREITVHFVVPSGFSGYFVVWKDPNGVIPLKSGETWKVVVPSNRKVALTDISFLYEWHAVKASFDDGTPVLDYLRIEASGKADDLVIRGLETDSAGKSYYFIGELSEARKFTTMNIPISVIDDLSKP